MNRKEALKAMLDGKSVSPTECKDFIFSYEESDNCFILKDYDEEDEVTNQQDVLAQLDQFNKYEIVTKPRDSEFYSDSGNTIILNEYGHLELHGTTILLKKEFDAFLDFLYYWRNI